MKIFSWLSCILVAVTAVGAKKQPTELHIETTFKPDTCTQQANKGDVISVHYTGTLYTTGDKFDSSLDRGQPFPLTLGAGDVIKGWDQGLLGMCLNEKRTLTIPPHLAYGTRGFSNAIPPNAALVFTVELVGVVDMSVPRHEEL